MVKLVLADTGIIIRGITSGSRRNRGPEAAAGGLPTPPVGGSMPLFGRRNSNRPAICRFRPWKDSLALDETRSPGAPSCDARHSYAAHAAKRVVGVVWFPFGVSDAFGVSLMQTFIWHEALRRTPHRLRWMRICTHFCRSISPSHRPSAPNLRDRARVRCDIFCEKSTARPCRHDQGEQTPQQAERGSTCYTLPSHPVLACPLRCALAPQILRGPCRSSHGAGWHCELAAATTIGHNTLVAAAVTAAVAVVLRS